MERKAVYKLVYEERVIQDSLGPKRTDGHTHSVGDELVLGNVYLRKAFEAWTNYPGDEQALKQLIKVVAIIVRCLENHGS